jgi:hypothetical protein
VFLGGADTQYFYPLAMSSTSSNVADFHDDNPAFTMVPCLAGRGWPLADTLAHHNGFPHRIAIYSGLAVMASRLVRLGLRRHGPKEFVEAKPAQQTRAVQFLMSLANAVFVTMHGFRHPFPAETPAQVLAVQAVMEPMCGYLVGDLVDTDFLGKPSDVFHHVVGFGLGTYVMSRPMAIRRLIAPISVAFARMELSTIFIDLMWFQREFPVTYARCVPAAVHDWVPMLFLGSFVATRCLAGPAIVAEMAIYRRSTWHACFTPGAQVGLAAFFALQYYWLALIVKMLKKMARKAKAKKKSDAAAAAAAMTSPPPEQQLAALEDSLRTA